MTLPCNGPVGRARRDAGFTLIEMIAVLAVMALLVGMVASRGVPVSPTTHARAAVRAISGALRAARSEALVSNRAVYFNVDTVNRRYWTQQNPAAFLTRDLNIALLTASEQVVTDGVGRIRFEPDGSSSGGRVAIAGGDRTWWVGVDWLSGRVSIAEKPH